MQKTKGGGRFGKNLENGSKTGVDGKGRFFGHDVFC